MSNLGCGETLARTSRIRFGLPNRNEIKMIEVFVRRGSKLCEGPTWGFSRIADRKRNCRLVAGFGPDPLRRIPALCFLVPCCNYSSAAPRPSTSRSAVPSGSARLFRSKPCALWCSYRVIRRGLGEAGRAAGGVPVGFIPPFPPPATPFAEE